MSQRLAREPGVRMYPSAGVDPATARRMTRGRRDAAGTRRARRQTPSNGATREREAHPRPRHAERQARHPARSAAESQDPPQDGTLRCLDPATARSMTEEPHARRPGKRPELLRDDAEIHRGYLRIHRQARILNCDPDRIFEDEANRGRGIDGELPKSRSAGHAIVCGLAHTRHAGKKAGCRRSVGTPRVNQRLRDVPGWNLKLSRLWRVQHLAATAIAANWTVLQQRNIATETASPCGRSLFAPQYRDRGISQTCAINLGRLSRFSRNGLPAFRRLRRHRRGERTRRACKRNGGGSHRPPRTVPSDAGRLAARERHAYSRALNSIWNLRGSLTEAV